MNVKFIVDDSETLRELRERFPDHFLRSVAVVLKNLARNNAQQQGFPFNSARISCRER